MSRGGVGRTPSVAVHVVVVGAAIRGMVRHTGKGVVVRHMPGYAGTAHADAKTQILCCVIHLRTAEEPHTLQVQGHIDLIACIGIVAIEPYLVVGGVYPLHPHVAYQHIGLNLIVIATVDHQLALPVQVVYCARGLAVGEIMNRTCRCPKGQQHHQGY